MKKRTKEILAILDEQYGREYVCYLNYETPWQLLIATMLSAQCTDARVNIVTADLFQKYDTLEKFANADLKELEQDIKPTGFYHNKAKNIIACTRDLLYRFGGEVPRSLDPEKIETDLMKELPKDHWILYNIQIITFGRSICTARSPKCEQCFLQKYCKEFKM